MSDDFTYISAWYIVDSMFMFSQYVWWLHPLLGVISWSLLPHFVEWFLGTSYPSNFTCTKCPCAHVYIYGVSINNVADEVLAYATWLAYYSFNGW